LRTSIKPSPPPQKLNFVIEVGDASLVGGDDLLEECVIGAVARPSAAGCALSVVYEIFAIFEQMHNALKNELRTIISGKSPVRHGRIIQAIACYLENGAKASSIPEDPKQIKEQEAENLRSFIADHALWLKEIDFSRYVSEGAEQKADLFLII
jgi:hypothetical protein